MNFPEQIPQSLQTRIAFNVLLEQSVKRPLNFVEKSLAVNDLISDYRDRLNKALAYREFFGYSQQVYNEQLLITLSRIFNDRKKYPTQCIDAVLKFMETNSSSLPQIKDRKKVFSVMLQCGFSQVEIDTVSELNDQKITELLVNYYRASLKTDSKSKSIISKALLGLRFARDKYIAHSEEQAHKFATSTYDEIRMIIEYVKQFIAVISIAYFDLTVFINGEYIDSMTSRSIRRPTLRVIEELLSISERDIE